MGWLRCLIRQAQIKSDGIIERFEFRVKHPRATGNPVTLVYIVAHKSADAAKASFDAFRQDPAWVTAKKASEDAAGGSLTAKDGVKSLFMKATDYSPMK